MKMPIETGYIAKWNEYPKDEVKVRIARPSPLGVPYDLWKLAKEGKISWQQYEERYTAHVMTDDKAHAKLMEILTILKEGKTVRLICYEKEWPCHRFTLKEALELFMEKELK